MNKEALILVENLNNEVQERGGLIDYSPFELRSFGQDKSAIYFMGIAIWTDCNDERDRIGETDEKEPLRKHIISESERILKDLNLKMGAF